jgi:uncharacterized protein DUF3658
MPDFDDAESDGPLTPEEEMHVRSLTAAELQRIDECLLSHASHSWHKVARVVVHTMFALHDEFPALPDGFYSIRIKHLVASGALEAAGNLSRMRYSEVRIPGSARSGVDR